MGVLEKIENSIGTNNINNPNSNKRTRVLYSDRTGNVDVAGDTADVDYESDKENIVWIKVGKKNN